MIEVTDAYAAHEQTRCRGGLIPDETNSGNDVAWSDTTDQVWRCSINDEHVYVESAEPPHTGFGPS